MDPTRNICNIKDSFNSINDKYEVKKYSEKSIMSPRTRRKKMTQNREVIELEYIPFSLPLDEININSELFSKDDIILANIDAIYNFSGQEDGYLKPQIIKNFDFAATDTSYLTYLQYRLPFSRGFLPCNKVPCEKCFLNKKGIDIRQLNTNCDENSLVDYVIDIVPEGVDLVISKSVVNNYRNNLITALKLCKPGGTFICRIDENQIDLSIKYINAICFETFSLFKPISESLNAPYSYIIAQNYKGNSIDWIDMLVGLDSKNIDISEDFVDYVENYYNQLSKLKGNLYENPVKYDTYKCKAIWNIF